MKHEFCNALKDAIRYGCTQPISMIVQHKLDEQTRDQLMRLIDWVDTHSLSGDDHVEHDHRVQ